MNDLRYTLFCQIHGQIRSLWCLIGIADACEVFDLASSGLSIDPFAVCLLAVFQRCGHMYEEEVTTRTTRLQDGFPCS